MALLLESKGYEWFLPLYRSKRRWSDRLKQVDVALFPGYVFCRFLASARLPILKTPSVIRIAGIGNVPTPVDENEIAAIRTVVSSGLGISPHPFLQVGQRVRIEGGTLHGLEGLVTDSSRFDRLVISISVLQQSVVIEVDSAWVIPVDTRETQTEPKPVW